MTLAPRGRREEAPAASPPARMPFPLAPRSRLSLAAVAALVVASACARSVEDGQVAPELASPATNPAPQNACVETQCPAPWLTCGGAAPCAVDPRSDVNHCGSCEKSCPKQTRSTGGTYVCTNGECQLACLPGYGNCNGELKDGCETPLESDPKNCGGCGITCKEGDPCWRGACGCPSGFVLCDGECKNIKADDDNCSACGQLCRAPADPADPRWICGPGVTPPETKWTCSNASCTLQCKPGRGDCNKEFCADGCEIDLLKDPNNCGSCGHACNPGQACVNGACLCPQGTTRCGNECVDTSRDPTNCGACGYMCPGASPGRPGRVSTGGPQCNGGECTYVCFPGFADCNGDVYDGCEAEIAKDQLNCGACGNKCNLKAGQPCVEGACLTKPCEVGPVR